MPTRDPADATAAVNAFAGELRQHIAPTGKFTTVGVSEIWCEDRQGNASEDGPYSIRGVYQGRNQVIIATQKPPTNR